MFLKRIYREHPEYRLGLQHQATVAMGIAAWGLMTGVAMVKSGLSPLEGALMTLLVYAGSAQLAAIPLLGAGAPIWVILATAFCVNLRFIVFSVHLRPHMMHLPRWERLVTGYLNGDLTYVYFSRRYPHAPQNEAEQVAQHAYLAGNCVINYGAWMVSSLLGVALANVIPTEWGLGFAGILALMGVGCSLITSRLRAVSAGVAASAAVVAYALPLKLNILVAIASAVAICLVLEAMGKAGPHDEARHV
ncbi:MAG TPA: AzlC family ABC transporter permease [Burkholderiaceae bacterium]|jgi:predicted branched-subunit amino acid permease|nr:AzlC family ABC transporter permease [Burkholderiaceae bacterium]